VSTFVPPQPSVAARLRGVRSSPVRDILALTARPGVISFAGGLPAPELFDADGLAAAFAAALRDAGRTLQYSTTEGDPELRAQVAARLTARGLPTEPDDVLITSGSQQALTLAAAVLIEPGDVVLVEEPSYLAALQSFALAGARVVPVACDDDGIDPDAVRRTLAGDPESGSVGLGNVDERLRQVYGDDYGLVVETAPGAGTKVSMRIPKYRAGVHP